MADNNNKANPSYNPKANLRGGFYATAKAIPGRVTLHPSMTSQPHSVQVAATRNQSADK